MGSFSFVTGYQHFQSGTLMPVGEKGSIPLLAVFQVALVNSDVTVSLGANFTVIDPISAKAVTGKSIVITGNDSAVITTPEGSGWFNTTGASVPPTANIYNTFGSGASSVTELVTSKVVLDDVGRSNLGGDLVTPPKVRTMN